MMELVEHDRRGRRRAIKIWIEPIHYASASDIKSRINELFDVKAANAPGAAGGGS